MSRRPLKDIFVSGRPSRSDYQVLTPRTPHSRAGRAEEAFTEVELEQLGDDERSDYQTYRQQQSEPLLAPPLSSSFAATGYRSKGDDSRKQESQAKRALLAALANTPLALGCLLAFLLLGAVLFIPETTWNHRTLLRHRHLPFRSASCPILCRHHTTAKSTHILRELHEISPHRLSIPSRMRRHDDRIYAPQGRILDCSRGRVHGCQTSRRRYRLPSARRLTFESMSKDPHIPTGWPCWTTGRPGAHGAGSRARTRGMSTTLHRPAQSHQES